MLSKQISEPEKNDCKYMNNENPESMEQQWNSSFRLKRTSPETSLAFTGKTK